MILYFVQQQYLKDVLIELLLVMKNEVMPKCLIYRLNVNIQLELDEELLMVMDFHPMMKFVVILIYLNNQELHEVLLIFQ